MNSVNDAITPAAAGIGKPLKCLPRSVFVSESAAAEAAMQLKRASRKAPHAR